ncbi:hypothetical protein A3A70_01800 [candidate division WWE3 bacterium RIFCSPLOWO2_01_FULL_42_11]|uniref:Uncharacterized protein n=1 Tax=candidate division WWE3 bacterium RIFCSPLOWO2_01_FULL_42_11 TaxID=1802627 RepID=A0A1F4VP70_UNCKA|nr:MAG: hypothetical protein A3A70_01800 [candidate division WWE3 bacterium RIFCSPLOWO2_01_FULL_42_11]
MAVDFLSLRRGDQLQVRVVQHPMNRLLGIEAPNLIYERGVQDLVLWNSQESDDEWYEIDLSGPDDSATLNIWMEDGVWQAVFALEDVEFYIPAAEAPSRLRNRGINFVRTWSELSRFESLFDGEAAEGVIVVDYEGDRDAPEKRHRMYLSDFRSDVGGGVVFYPRLGVIVDVEEIKLLSRANNEQAPAALDDLGEDDIPF